MSNIKALINIPISNLVNSKTARDTYIVSLADGSLALLTAITTALIARSLLPNEFGTLIALWTFLTLISALMDLGIGGGIIAYVAGTRSLEQKNQYIGSALFFLFLIGFIQFVALTTGVKLVQNLLFPQINLQLIRLMALGSWWLILGRFVNDALRAKQEFLKSGLITIIFASVRLFLIMGLILYHRLTLYSCLFVIAFSPIIYFGLGYYLLDLHIKYLKWDRQVIHQVMIFSGWLGVNQIVTTISSRIDVLLLNRIAGAFSAGIYGTAMLMVRIFVIATSSMLSVFSPRIIQLQEKTQRRQFLHKICLVILAGWLGLVIVGLLAKPLITIIFGVKYLSALTPFYLLLIAMAGLMATVPVILPIIYILKKPWIIANLSIIQLVIIILGNLILIPKYNYLAPPILLIISQFFIVVVGSYYTIQWLKSAH